MHPPFTSEQFFEVFRRYNETVWPAQIFLIGIGLLGALAAHRANARRSCRWARIALASLAALWLWSGIVYHKQFFATLTAVGQVFGSLFIAEAGLLLIAAWSIEPALERTSRWSRAVAAALLLYALAAYPAIGVVAGHRYPAAPTFGAPCPTTIYTFGIFCALSTSIPRFAMAIPIVWAAIGSYAAFAFGVREDLGLVAGAIAVVIATTTSGTSTAPPRPATSQAE